MVLTSCIQKAFKEAHVLLDVLRRPSVSHTNQSLYFCIAHSFKVCEPGCCITTSLPVYSYVAVSEQDSKSAVSLVMSQPAISRGKKHLKSNFVEAFILYIQYVLALIYKKTGLKVVLVGLPHPFS